MLGKITSCARFGLILSIACLTLAACSPTVTAVPSTATSSPATAAPASTPGSLPAETATASPTAATPPTGTAAPLPSASPSRTPTATGLPGRISTVLPPVSVVDQLLARCPTAAEVAAVTADCKLTFDADPTKGTLVCGAATGSADLTVLQRRIYETIQVAKRLTFSKPLPWTSKPLYDWLRGAIKGMRFRADIALSYCCDPANTIDVRIADNQYTMLTDRWVEPGKLGGLADLLVLLVHEARHNEGFLHDCGANDKTIAELGAWGVQYQFLTWLADYADPAFLTDASLAQIYRADAVNIRQSRFCNEGK